jgi:hypothetical protein
MKVTLKIPLFGAKNVTLYRPGKREGRATTAGLPNPEPEGVIAYVNALATPVIFELDFVSLNQRTIVMLLVWCTLSFAGTYFTLPTNVYGEVRLAGNRIEVNMKV